MLIDNSIAILQLMLTPGIGTSTINKILHFIKSANYTFNELLNMPATEIERIFGIKKNIANDLININEMAYSIADELYRNEIYLLVKDSEKYPRKLLATLKDYAPPVLFAKGNLDILNRPSVGFCGSRKASEIGCNVAYDTSTLLAADNVNIVSGYAQGIDTAAHLAALKTGGYTTFVLATGILHFRAKSILDELLNTDNYVVVSEFSPRLGWVARNAMQRNRTIIGLSDVVIIIESGKTGGTFEAGKTALGFKKPLFVAQYSNQNNIADGNNFFLDRGAFPLRKTKDGKPNLKKVFEILDNSINCFHQHSLF